MELHRPHPTDDFDEVLALVQACDRAVYRDSDWTAAELREEWDGLGLGADAWVAFEDGRLAGVMHVYERVRTFLALLHEGFRRFIERGETTAALGVDNENPTGATRLYERVGMRILWRAGVWRKELRPGA